MGVTAVVYSGYQPEQQQFGAQRLANSPKWAIVGLQWGEACRQGVDGSQKPETAAYHDQACGSIIRTMGLRFEWHETKACANRRKHRVAFEEAKTVFGDPRSLVVPDVVHSEGEDRWVRIGISARGRLLVVVYTERGDVIRLISGRRATIGEEADYEQTNQRPEGR